MDWNTLARWEALTGLNILSAGLMFNNPSVTVVRGMLWAAMVPTNPDVTLEDAGKVLLDIMKEDGVSVLDVVERVTRTLVDLYKLSTRDKDPTGAASVAEN